MSNKTNHEGFLLEALEQAKLALQCNEVPVGAIIVKSDTIVARGFNQKHKTNNPLMHAEIIAIQSASANIGNWRLQGCSLYVTLEPCIMCLGAIQHSRIEHVYYGVPDLKGGALSLGYSLNTDTRTNHRFSVTHIPHEKCGQILTQFFKNKRS